MGLFDDLAFSLRIFSSGSCLRIVSTPILACAYSVLMFACASSALMFYLRVTTAVFVIDSRFQLSYKVLLSTRCT
jgi:hypothetical protein